MKPSERNDPAALNDLCSVDLNWNLFCSSARETVRNQEGTKQLQTKKLSVCACVCVCVSLQLRKAHRWTCLHAECAFTWSACALRRRGENSSTQPFLNMPELWNADNEVRRLESASQASLWISVLCCSSSGSRKHWTHTQSDASGSAQQKPHLSLFTSSQLGFILITWSQRINQEAARGNFHKHVHKNNETSFIDAWGKRLLHFLPLLWEVSL